MARALSQRGHDVRVVTTDACSPTARIEPSTSNYGLDVRRLKNLNNYLAWHQHLFLPIGLGRTLSAAIANTDIVHVHEFRTLLSVAVRKQCRKFGVPYILSAHGSVLRLVNKIPWKAAFDADFGHQILHGAAHVIAISDAERRQYESVGVETEKIRIIPNGIDRTEFENLPLPGLFKRKYNLQGRRIIGYIGRLNARKGLDTLVQSFKDLNETMDDLALVLAGPDDGYGRRIQAMVNDLDLRRDVVFPGLVTSPEKLELFIDSDVIVYPSQHEIFGLVPFEALACGRPVIVANDSGCGEIVARENAGVTITPGDTDALTSALITTLNGGALVDEAVENGRRFVQSELDWDTVARRTEEVYAQAITLK